jgi:hypothetical protein
MGDLFKQVIMTPNGFEMVLIAPALDKSKKYSVYHGKSYILSFGDINSKHYRDKLGYYSNMNHLNGKLRKKWWEEHKLNDCLSSNDITNEIWWIAHYLY